MSPDQIIIGNLSGLEDKDVQEASRVLETPGSINPKNSKIYSSVRCFRFIMLLVIDNLTLSLIIWYNILAN